MNEVYDEKYKTIDALLEEYYANKEKGNMASAEIYYDMAYKLDSVYVLRDVLKKSGVDSKVIEDFSSVKYKSEKYDPAKDTDRLFMGSFYVYNKRIYNPIGKSAPIFAFLALGVSLFALVILANTVLTLSPYNQDIGVWRLYSILIFIPSTFIGAFTFIIGVMGYKKYSKLKVLGKEK